MRTEAQVVEACQRWPEYNANDGTLGTSHREPFSRESHLLIQPGWGAGEGWHSCLFPGRFISIQSLPTASEEKRDQMLISPRIVWYSMKSVRCISQKQNLHNLFFKSMKWPLAVNTHDLLVVSLVAQTIRNLPAMRQTWVQSLGPEDPLEKEIATHSNILAWRIPWTEEPGGLQSMGVTKSRTGLSD